MSWQTRLTRGAVVVLCGMALSGCFPTNQSPLDEEREPHFQLGKARASSMDYKGAIEAFEKALEVNPRSSVAHFELGLLCEKNEMDYAAAIYHFQRYLALRPNSEYADIVRQRIQSCKQELAKTVSLGPVTQNLQREFEQLAEENRRLRDEVERLRPYNPGRSGTPTNAPGRLASDRTTQITGASQTPPRPGQVGVTPLPARTHIVQAGDTPAAIARKHGVRLDALMAANPGLNPTRMQIGQTIKLPSP